MNKLQELKDAMIYTIQNSETSNVITLFEKLLQLLFSYGFSAGQKYICSEHNYEKIIHCKDCKYQKTYRTGLCPYFTTNGSIAPDYWFCADGVKEEEKE